MDTDYLTEEAYDVLIRESEKVSEFLRVDIRASSRDFRDENSFLKGTIEFLKEIAEDPMDYLEGWSLEEELDEAEFKQSVLQLIKDIEKVINIPIKNRIPSEFS